MPPDFINRATGVGLFQNRYNLRFGELRLAHGNFLDRRTIVRKFSLLSVVIYGELTRELGYRWGSCGKHNILSFNWRLLQLPLRLIDYVVAHELAHLTQTRHDKQFWDSLDRALPDWRERNEDLRIKARAYLVFDL